MIEDVQLNIEHDTEPVTIVLTMFDHALHSVARDGGMFLNNIPSVAYSIFIAQFIYTLRTQDFYPLSKNKPHNIKGMPSNFKEMLAV